MNLQSILSLVRPRQWVKNLFVFAPLFFTPEALTWPTTSVVVMIFLAFCLTASGLYCFNDYCDRESDRSHPVKRNRPVAAGSVKPGMAVVLAGVLIAGGFGLAIWQAGAAFPALATYAGMGLIYTLWLKRFAIIDVLVISLGFVLRVYAGTLAIALFPTVWILICTGLLALFLALAKRRDDLVQDLDVEHRDSLDGYSLAFLDASIIVVMATLLVSYVIFTTDTEAMHRLGSDKLYFTVPFVIAGVLRHLQLTIVYHRSGSPTDLALSDPFLIGSVLGWLAAFALLIHF